MTAVDETELDRYLSDLNGDGRARYAGSARDRSYR